MANQTEVTGGPKRILIVDDHPFFRRLLAKAVERAGYAVCGEVVSGENAVGSFLELRPDLVLLDVDLPVRDGISILRGLREVDPTAKVIMVTGTAAADVVAKAVALGACGYVVKPLDLETATRVLREAFEPLVGGGEEGEIEEEADPEPEGAGLPRLLVIEDQAVMRRILHRVAELAGCEIVAEASSAHSGLAMYQDLRPDLVLLDLNLPDGNGLDVLEAIKRREPGARVVIATGLAHPQSVQRAVASGADGYVLKPFEPAKVAEVLRRVLGLPELD